MTLYEKLQQARSEEDIKDAYIKALGLKEVSRNLIDIQTKEIWFEAKEGNRTSTYAMFTQLLHYIQAALNKGEYVPPFLCVIDAAKAAIMKTDVVLPFLAQKTIKWGTSASNYTQEALEAVSAFIGTHFVSFRIVTHENEFIETVRNAIKSGEIIRTQITPDNLKQVFDKWVKMVGCEIKDASPDDYALLFFADVMSDGTVSTHENLPAGLIHKNNKPAFLLGGRLYELGNQEGYRQFWAIYDRPPKAEYRNYLLERRDSLIPTDERSFKGAYYTPLHVVDKAYDMLAETLGKNWQREYIVWDMCCGVGNLETKHANHRNLYMSTLDQADVDVMKAARTCVAAQRFQYDYLNDDVTPEGTIDYSLTGKIPESLRRAIADKKKILVLINPPYAEATNADNTSNKAGDKDAESKKGVSNTLISKGMNIGYAQRELFVQFLIRIQMEIPHAAIAMFSTLKYVNAPNFELFRNMWRAEYKGGFIVHSKAFDGLKGNFPIGFLIWQQNPKTDPISSISTVIFDKKAVPIGEKSFFNMPNSFFLSEWIERPRANNEDAIPLKSAVSPTTSVKDVRGTKWADGAIASMYSAGNDLQHAGTDTSILSSGYCSAGAFFVTAENLWQAAIVFTVRRIVKPTWLNDRDQFLQPTGELSDEFKADCLVWMLFNGSNLTAGADGLVWDGRTWSIVNHFIPYTEQEVDAPDRFESDFMVQYMADKTFSEEAQAVLDEGRRLWTAYFSLADSHDIRSKLALNRPDAGWYQVRNALRKRNESGDYPTVRFDNFEQAYKNLSDKLRPMVYELGFLK